MGEAPLNVAAMLENSKSNRGGEKGFGRFQGNLLAAWTDGPPQRRRGDIVFDQPRTRGCCARETSWGADGADRGPISIWQTLKAGRR